jgi:hypothetical protein
MEILKTSGTRAHDSSADQRDQLYEEAVRIVLDTGQGFDQSRTRFLCRSQQTLAWADPSTRGSGDCGEPDCTLPSMGSSTGWPRRLACAAGQSPSTGAANLTKNAKQILGKSETKWFDKRISLGSGALHCDADGTALSCQKYSRRAVYFEVSAGNSVKPSLNCRRGGTVPH